MPTTCQHTDVEEIGQAGERQLILKWKIVKLTGLSALVIALLTVNSQMIFPLKTVHPTSPSSFFNHLLVIRTTVLQTECKAKTSTK